MERKISIIIPFLNEEENIPNLIGSLDQFFKKKQLLSCEVVFVDDGSTDASIHVLLKGLNRCHFSAKVIKLSKNFGSHAAVRAGLLSASGDCAMFLAADQQDPLELISDLLNKIDEGYDIVFALRGNTASGFLERLFTKTYAFLMHKYVHKNYPVNGFDVVLFNRKVIDNLNKNIESNSSILLQILIMGFKQAYILYEKVPRQKGSSKWTLGKKVKLFMDSFIAFSFTPIRFVTVIGIIFFLVGIGWTLYISLRKIYYDDLTTGWPMLTSILFLGFGLTNISLGIIAEYLWRTLDVSRRRPVFIIDEIIELKGEES